MKKKINTKKVWLIVIVISIILVPTLYGVTYLKSYWNNGTTINKVPIAVVNLDSPYKKDGKTFNIGDTLVNNLKTNTALDWKFVSYSRANKGLYGDKYYAMVVIPKDFSKDIANITKNGFKKPKIDFYQNQGKNFIFSEISGIGVEQVKNTVSSSISKSLSKVLVSTIYQSKDGFKSAMDGSNKLESGINKLNYGANSLNSGAGELLSGSITLNNGVSKLSNGQSRATKGTGELLDGAKALNNGQMALEMGSSKLNVGAKALEEGSTNLASGAMALKSGGNELLQGVNSLKKGSTKLLNGTGSLNIGAEKLKDGLGKISKGSNEVANGQEAISKEMEVLQSMIKAGNKSEALGLLEKMEAQNSALNSGMAKVNNGLEGEIEGSSKLQDGLSSLRNGINGLNYGISKVQNGMESLNNGIGKVSGGAQDLNSGLVKETSGVAALSDGIKKASKGSVKLENGLNKVYQGNEALGQGMNSLQDGAEKLNGGLVTLKTGTDKLSNGLTTANKGANSLSSGLAKGYNELNKNVTFTAEEMSNFIANPVSLNTVSINPVDSYGVGFAPYFICIGLFVGAMYAYFMTSALSRKFKGSFKKRFTKTYLIGASICIIQAFIISMAVYFGLGLKTETPEWFFFVNILTAIAIYSLINGLHYIITPIMKGALVVIMVLQFTACGGSYPVLVMPTFYNVIHPFLVLSYGVDLMRMATTGINYSIFYSDIKILILWIVITTILGFIVGYLKIHITHKRSLKEKSELISKEEMFNQYV